MAEDCRDGEVEWNYLSGDSSSHRSSSFGSQLHAKWQF
jgi:hypothetical protein